MMMMVFLELCSTKISFENDIGLREMEKGGLTIQPWENENMSRIFCFSKYRVFMKTHVLLGNSIL